MSSTTEKVIMDETHKITGSWKFLRILGSGGFGQVSLWYDSFTGQKIALKKLHESTLKDPTVNPKLIERWCNEVEIMKKLGHVNIVSILEIPDELKMEEPLPVLAMEYCCNGDLRQVLNKAENCCGLCEPDVLNILKDISNGLAYLHSCKIIHRDIKPENIVLQQKDKSTIYKLIDLGYAKALDESSLSRSFVGTIQYIAPELFMGKEYTSSVDYWSFGLTAHEIITGYRPFLHGFRPSDWMKQIQNKSRSVICVVQNGNGEIIFNSEISRNNHLTRCFLDDIEKWLQLALDWNGQSRGRDEEKNRLVIFEQLTDILCKKLIKVFSLPTYDILSYEVTDETDISDLRIWLKEDTDLEENDQLLLLPNGKSVNMKGNLFKNIGVESLDRSSVSIFLYNSGPVIVKTFTERPSFVSDFKNYASNLLSSRQLKAFCADSVYFLQSQRIRYRNFLQGIGIKIANTKRKTSEIESFYEELENEWARIENYGRFLAFSHKIDLESYIRCRKAGKLKASPFVRKWIANTVNINSKISELKNSFNKTKQRQLVLLAKKRCQNLEDYSSNDMIRVTPLDGLVEKSQNLWESAQKLSDCDSEFRSTSVEAVRLIDRSLEETNKFLKSHMLKALFVKISEADENLANFLSHLTNIYKSMNILKLMIQHVQAERQKEVWSMIEQSSQYPKDELRVREAADCEATEAPVAIKAGSTAEQESISNLSYMLNTYTDATSLPNLHNARSVIEDNNRLRCRIQEVQQNLNEILAELNSFRWDIIQE